MSWDDRRRPTPCQRARRVASTSAAAPDRPSSCSLRRFRAGGGSTPSPRVRRRAGTSDGDQRRPTPHRRTGRRAGTSLAGTPRPVPPPHARRGPRSSSANPPRTAASSCTRDNAPTRDGETLGPPPSRFARGRGFSFALGRASSLRAERTRARTRRFLHTNRSRPRVSRFRAIESVRHPASCPTRLRTGARANEPLRDATSQLPVDLAGARPDIVARATAQRITLRGPAPRNGIPGSPTVRGARVPPSRRVTARGGA